MSFQHWKKEEEKELLENEPHATIFNLLWHFMEP